MMEIIEGIRSLLYSAKYTRGQGSIEYIMMLSAVSIIIVIALAMVMEMKGVATHTFFNSSNQSIASELSRDLSNLSNAGN